MAGTSPACFIARALRRGHLQGELEGLLLLAEKVQHVLNLHRRKAMSCHAPQDPPYAAWPVWLTSLSSCSTPLILGYAPLGCKDPGGSGKRSRAGALCSLTHFMKLCSLLVKSRRGFSLTRTDWSPSWALEAHWMARPAVLLSSVMAAYMRRVIGVMINTCKAAPCMQQ
jgi:hypothetical protein